MTFHKTQLDGIVLIDLDSRNDERGNFFRTYCEHEFSANGLNTRWLQMNATRTVQKGSVRGLHWQAEPQPEIKVIRCSSGTIWDVVVDIRPGSETFGRWLAFELSPARPQLLYVSFGFAHGFQCLNTDCELNYMMSEFHVPDLARGIRWDDPKLDIPWPLPVSVISDRDRNLPCLESLVPLLAKT